MKWLRCPAVVFGVALLLRLVAMIAVASPDEVRTREFSAWRWGHEPAAIAEALVRGDGFADPFARGTGPTGWLPPLYPGLVAACFALFGGVKAAAAAALYTLQAVFSAATAPLLIALGKKLALERAGRIAAWAWALHPMAIWYAIHEVWDTVLVATAVTAFVLLMFHVGRGPRPGRAAFLGAAFGVVLLLNPAPLALVPAVLLYLAPLPLRRALVTAVAFGAGALLVCLPWSLRNWLVLGTPGLRSNLGVELYVGNNDLANGQHVFDYHPGWTDAETADLKALGESKYSASRGERAKAWIKAHPQRFAELCVTRARIFWLGEFPPHDRRTFEGKSAAQDPKSWVHWIVHLATGVLGVLGTLLLLRERRAEAWFLAGALVFFPLTYYVIHVLERYRFPIEPLLVLAAAHVVVKCRGNAASRQSLAAGAPPGHHGPG